MSEARGAGGGQEMKQGLYRQHRGQEAHGRRCLERTPGLGVQDHFHSFNQFKQQYEDRNEPKKVLSAKELTGAPLISFVPKHRKVLRKKISEPLEKEKKKLPEYGRLRQQNQIRLRHRSEQCVDQLGNPPPAVPYFYQGPNLYHKLLSAQNSHQHIQDFYENPEFRKLHQGQAQFSKSIDNLSESDSATSDDDENFIPRIIKPRRRRKKEKKLGEGSAVTRYEHEETLCLGSEKQWLPTGLLSAESCLDSRSETGFSSEDDNPVSTRQGGRRKLASTMSVPVHIGLRATQSSSPQETRSPESDYVSMTSVSSALSLSTAPSSSSSDHLFDSDSGSGSVVGAGSTGSSGSPEAGLVLHAPLKESKSVSCSYFRSPKTEARKLGGDRGYHSLEKEKPASKHLAGGQLPLRKTNSWAFTGSTGGRGSQFSLFSPVDSCDLLSGVRKDLSRLDIRPGQEARV